jgi:hypothetical protein
LRLVGTKASVEPVGRIVDALLPGAAALCGPRFDEIARILVVVAASLDGGAAGLFETRPGGGVRILLSSSPDHADELAWTTAHELGHLVLHLAAGMRQHPTDGMVVVGEYLAQMLAADLVEQAGLSLACWREIDRDDLIARAQRLRNRHERLLESTLPDQQQLDWFANHSWRVARDHAYAAGLADATGNADADDDAAWLSDLAAIRSVIEPVERMRTVGWTSILASIGPTYLEVGAMVEARLARLRDPAAWPVL